MILPSSLKAGFSAARASRAVVSGRMPWSVDVGVAVDCNGIDLALEAALLGRLVRRAGGSAGRSRRAPSGGSPTCRRSSRPRCPAGRGRSAPSARARRRSRAPACTSACSPRRRCGPCARRRRRSPTSWTPEAISAAAKLTACWAEPHWRSTVVAGVSIGSPASSQALRAMLMPLLAELLDAAGDDVLDLARRRCRRARSPRRRSWRAGWRRGRPCSSPSPRGRGRSGSGRPPRSRPRGHGTSRCYPSAITLRFSWLGVKILDELTGESTRAGGLFLQPARGRAGERSLAGRPTATRGVARRNVARSRGRPELRCGPDRPRRV